MKNVAIWSFIVLLGPAICFLVYWSSGGVMTPGPEFGNLIIASLVSCLTILVLSLLGYGAIKCGGDDVWG